MRTLPATKRKTPKRKSPDSLYSVVLNIPAFLYFFLKSSLLVGTLLSPTNSYASINREMGKILRENGLEDFAIVIGCLFMLFMLILLVVMVVGDIKNPMSKIIANEEKTNRLHEEKYATQKTSNQLKNYSRYNLSNLLTNKEIEYLKSNWLKGQLSQKLIPELQYKVLQEVKSGDKSYEAGRLASWVLTEISLNTVSSHIKNIIDLANDENSSKFQFDSHVKNELLLCFNEFLQHTDRENCSIYLLLFFSPDMKTNKSVYLDLSFINDNDKLLIIALFIKGLENIVGTLDLATLQSEFLDKYDFTEYLPVIDKLRY